jgi:hypothetical protein
MRRAETRVPDPNQWAAVDRRVLELMDARLSVGEIADTLIVEFPRLLGNRSNALTQVCALSDRYARSPVSPLP